uniref:hypothetical protein n=1 Tax=Pseudomonas sp. CFBP 13711 TaxID=2775310 RepID=UPI001FD6289E|nr:MULTISPECIES: hypothetical protein [unclassified Pseudomonas]
MKIAEASVVATPQKETLDPDNLRPIPIAFGRITDHYYPASACEFVAWFKPQTFARLQVDLRVGLHATQLIAKPMRGDSWEKLLNGWAVRTRKI